MDKKPSRFSSKKYEEMKAHNADSTNLWKKGLNQFSDITKEEFKSIYLKPIETAADVRGTVYNSNGYYLQEIYHSASDDTSKFVPLNRTLSCGKVWDQQSCGCCYAFSMINTIECNYNIAKGTLPALSRQQIVDCNALTGGCNGGDPQAVAFYARSQGMMNDASYGFTGKKGTCQYKSANTGIYLDGVELPGQNYPSKGTNPLLSSSTVYNMLTRGAVSISIDATLLESYKSGILNMTGCTSANHAVMIVGYGVDSATQKPYWIMKNSWNTWWGESGYARLVVKDDSTGNCFINNGPYRPFKN